MKRVVVISGAGISAESGLKTFRGADGLWRGYRPEEVACPEDMAAARPVMRVSTRAGGHRAPSQPFFVEIAGNTPAPQTRNRHASRPGAGLVPASPFRGSAGTSAQSATPADS